MEITAPTSIDPLLHELRRREVRIWADAGRLKYEAPEGVLTDDLLDRLRRHKPEILQRLDALTHTAFLGDRSTDGPPVLSFAQERMWLVWKLAPLSPAYNIAVVVKVRGAVNEASLLESLHRLRRRHNILRTRFADSADSAIPIVDEDDGRGCPVIAIESGTLSERELVVAQHLAEEAASPFDLRNQAPYYARIYRLDPAVYWIFVKLHHIAVDASSIAVLLRELADGYAAADGNASSVAAASPCIQYADFAAWQRRRLQQSYRDELQAYWRRQLSGPISPVRLPTDRPRRSFLTGRGGRVSFELPADVSTALADLGRRYHATLFMVLVSAFRILLHRYTSNPDFAITTPAINRNHPDAEGLIGYFGNTLPLRNPISATDSYVDVLIRERTTAVDAFEHQEWPFELMADGLTADGGMPRSQLFQVMFSFAEADEDAAWWPGVKVDVVEVETSTAKLDLLLAMQESRAGLTGVFEYAADLFDRETIERMAGHFEVVLSKMARRPDERIVESSILTQPERQRLLHDWNDTARSRAPHVGLAARFDAQARARPDAVALHCDGQRVTYGELNREADRICLSLLERGLRPEHLVAVFMRRTPRLVAALLGVLKAGGAYVPIDPLYPAERVRLMLERSRAELIVTERGSDGSLPWIAGNLLVVDDLDQHAIDATALPTPVRKPESLAYVLFTSGSTGTPKGVMVEEHSVTNLLDWAYETYSSQDLAVVLAATSVCFDLSVFELFVPLCAGHRVVLASDALALPALKERDIVTLVNTVPSVMRVLLDSHADVLPRSLRVVNLAGEPLPTRLVDEVYRWTRTQKVYDLYGPTEATTYSTFKLRLPQQPAVIGRPLSNTRGYVLDDHGIPVPVGIPGELHLAGDGLARGYLRDPALTADRFVTPRTTLVPETRLYRTGDIVCHTPNGDLEFRGRRDDQIKIRGFRIEPSEVRDALLSVTGVDDAWVIPRPLSPEGAPSLVAYVVGEAASVSAGALRLHLRRRLPEYMIPSAFIHVKSIPLTPNGKLDAARLEALDAAELPDDETSRPQTQTERQVLAIWREQLNNNHIGVHDEFFAIGGHSLTAMRITARLKDALAIDLSLQAIFLHSTVAALAAHIDALRGTAFSAQLPPLRRNANGQTALLTLLQQRLWLIHNAVEDSSFLNVATSFSVRGPFDVDSARQALVALGARHPILRSRFTSSGQELWQHVDPEASLDVALHDLRNVPRDRIDDALAAVAASAGRPFDLRKGPCCRLAIACVSDDCHMVLIVVHHIAADEWALGVLGREFAEDYNAFANRLPSTIPVPSFTFADYAAWEHSCRADGLFDRQLSEWTSSLGPPLPRVTFRWRDAQARRSEPIESYPIEIEPSRAEAIAAVAGRERCSVYVVLLSAFKRLIHAETGARDIRVSTNLAARHRPELEKVVGPMADTLILRTDLPSDHTAVTALRLVRDGFVAACGRRDVPFEQIARHLEQHAGVSRQDLAQTFFLFHEDGPAMPPLVGLALESAPIDASSGFFKSAAHDYDLIVFLSRDGDGAIRGQITLKGAFGDRVMASELVETYNALLADLVRQSESGEAAMR